MKKPLLIFLSMLFAAPAVAQNNVSLESEIMIERMVEKDGKREVTVEVPKVVVPGDRLVFIISYKNQAGTPATDFVVTNPLPPAVTFDSVEGSQAVVSVDGGKTYGQLAALKVSQADGTERAALPADVTHIRWAFSEAIPAGAAGTLRFKGVVK